MLAYMSQLEEIGFRLILLPDKTGWRADTLCIVGSLATDVSATSRIRLFAPHH